MSDAPLSPEEFAVLVAMDGGVRQYRASPEIEIKLRRLGLIEPSKFSGIPVRTPAGDARVKAGKG